MLKLMPHHWAASYLAVVSTITTSLIASPSAVRSKVPLEADLKVRVGQFYAASIKQDWSAMLELIAPFVRECSTAEDMRLGWTKDSPVKVLSWSLVEIRSNRTYSGQEFKVDCTRQTYRVDAGALVVTSQLDQEGEGKPERGKNFLLWVLIDGVWYLEGPE